MRLPHVPLSGQQAQKTEVAKLIHKKRKTTDKEEHENIQLVYENIQLMYLLM